jgi:hypothetical protein
MRHWKPDKKHMVFISGMPREEDLNFFATF